MSILQSTTQEGLLQVLISSIIGEQESVPAGGDFNFQNDDIFEFQDGTTFEFN